MAARRPEIVAATIGTTEEIIEMIEKGSVIEMTATIEKDPAGDVLGLAAMRKGIRR